VTTTPTAGPLEDDATRLSTQPRAVEAPGPVRKGAPRQPLAPVRRAWRQLTSMRTALLLLFLLALAAVPGGFLPQRRINPIRVTQYLSDHKTLGPLFDKLSLYDVFDSSWFSAVYLLLFVSLVGCLGPRIRLHARALRSTPPKAPATLSRLPVSQRWEASADDPLAAAHRALRGWRVVRRDGALSAEKGYLRETGNLVFHVSLVVLLVGIAVGAFQGFKGTVLVKEGDGFANTIASYDDINPGRRFDASSLVPLAFRLEDFVGTYGKDGKALTFDAHVRWASRPGGPMTPYDVQVNHPLHVGAAKVYLVGHGYAPQVVVRDGKGNVIPYTVPCLPQTPQFLSNCVLKVPDALPDQLGFQGVFTPTTVLGPTGRVGSAGPAAADPALTLVAYSGDLQLDAGIPQSVYELDTTRMTALDSGRAHALRPGDVLRLPGGGSLTYVGTKEWATFQLTQDPGKGVALVAAIGMVGGLLLSLFVRRRRVWVRACPAGGPQAPGRTVVEVGGLARTDPEAFAAEFAELCERLRTATAAPPAAAPPAIEE